MEHSKLEGSGQELGRPFEPLMSSLGEMVGCMSTLAAFALTAANETGRESRKKL